MNDRNVSIEGEAAKGNATLTEYASNRPYVNRDGVMGSPQKHFGCSVPQSDNLQSGT